MLEQRSPLAPQVLLLRPPLAAALLGWLSLVALLLAVYAPALRGTLLLDDALHLTAPELRSWSGLWRIWSEPGLTQQYYPLLHTAFWIQHKLWGDALWPYHVASVLQHAGCAVLVGVLVRQLALPGAVVAALLFALHPLQVESVAWIAEQKNTLSGLFFLAATCCWLRFDRTRARRDYFLASVCFAAALLGKTATVTLPPALLVLAWWRRGRIGWRRDLAPLLPWFGAALLAGLVTLRIEHALIAGVEAALPLTALQRLLLAGRALVFYASQLLWPSGQSFLYERWIVTPADPVAWFYPLAVSVALAACCWSARRGRRGPLAALLCFAGTLGPVLGVADVQWFVFSFVADHFVYLACLGLIVPAAAALRTRAPAAVTAALVVALALLSAGHSRHFADPIALCSHAASRSPRSAVAHYHLALALLADGTRRADAIAALRATLALNPAVADAHARLGVLLAEHPDNRAAAIAHLQSALKLAPERTGLHLPLADLLADDPGRLEEALRAYDAAIAHDPGSFAAHFNAGNTLLGLGRPADAIARFERAVQLRPDYAPAHSNLGLALARVPGRLRDSVPHFETALRLDPAFEPARRNLLRVRAHLGPGDAPR